MVLLVFQDYIVALSLRFTASCDRWSSHSLVAPSPKAIIWRPIQYSNLLVNCYTTSVLHSEPCMHAWLIGMPLLI